MLKTILVLFQGFAPARFSLLLALGAYSLIAGPVSAAEGDFIEVLGVETTVIDRQVEGDVWLSDQLRSDEATCAEQHAAESAAFYKCVLRFLKSYKKADWLTGAELGVLVDVLGAIRDGELEPPPEVATSLISLRVTTPVGTVVAGVAVTDAATGDLLATTGTDGLADVTLVASTDYVLHLSADGHSDKILKLTSVTENGSFSLSVTMAPRESATLSSDTGVVWTNEDGSSVTLDSGAFQTASGEVVAVDNIDVSMTSLDVLNSSEIAAFPADFTVLDESGIHRWMYVMGVGEFEFFDSGTGEALQLVGTATIRMPVTVETAPDGTAVTEGMSVPLYTLDETLGEWTASGAGQIEAATDGSLELVAQVNHFSWWNFSHLRHLEHNTYHVRVDSDQLGQAVLHGGFLENGITTYFATMVLDLNTLSPEISTPAGMLPCFYAEVTTTDGLHGTTDTGCYVNADTLVILTAPSAGDVAIGVDGELTGNFGVVLEKVSLFSTTLQRGVSYTQTGGRLPDGVTLQSSGATTAELVGRPMESGTGSVTITATSDTGMTDSVTIPWAISGLVAPDLSSLVGQTIRMFPETVTNANSPWDDCTTELKPAVDINNDHNTGSIASDWVLTYSSDGIYGYSGFIADYETLYVPEAHVDAAGILWVRPCSGTYSVTVTGTNAAGSSTASFNVKSNY